MEQDVTEQFEPAETDGTLDEAVVDAADESAEETVEVADDAVDAEETVEADDTAEVEDAEVDSEEPDEDDPLEKFRRELWAKPGDWFVVHTYSGMENRVKQNLENRAISLNMEDYIHEIVVPTEEVAEIKNGQRKMVKRTVLPGYVLVRMDLTDESWSAVRHTPSVTGFVGNSHQPVPLTMSEVEDMLAADHGQEAGRGRGLRGLGLGHGRRRPVRHAARDDHRDQRREPARQGARGDLRPGDPGRAVLQPDPARLTHRSGGPAARPRRFGRSPGSVPQ